MTFRIYYYAGTYEGERTVQAENGEHAVAIVRAWVRRQMSLTLYADGYKILEVTA